MLQSSTPGDLSDSRSPRALFLSLYLRLPRLINKSRSRGSNPHYFHRLCVFSLILFQCFSLRCPEGGFTGGRAPLSSNDPFSLRRSTRFATRLWRATFCCYCCCCFWLLSSLSLSLHPSQFLLQSLPLFFFIFLPLTLSFSCFSLRVSHSLPLSHLYVYNSVFYLC